MLQPGCCLKLCGGKRQIKATPVSPFQIPRVFCSKIHISCPRLILAGAMLDTDEVYYYITHQLCLLASLSISI